MISKFFQIAKKNLRGFSLIELLVVIGIVGILVGIMVVGLREVREKTQRVRTFTWAMSIHDQLKSDLVAGWTFNEGKGTIAYDVTGRYHGRLRRLHAILDCPETLPPSCPTWTDGVPELTGKALRFDGGPGFVDIGNVLHFEGRTSFTISFWINEAGADAQWRIVIGKYGWIRGIREGWIIERSRNENTFLFVRERYNERDIVEVPFKPNVWHHLTFTYDGNVMRGYLNGELKALTPSTKELIRHHESLKIGAFTHYYIPIRGIIDDLYIYSRALTAQEIQQRYAEAVKKYKLSMTVDY